MTKARKRKNGSIAEKMLDPATLQQIALWLDDAGVTSIEIETEGGRFVRIAAGAGVTSNDAGVDADVPVSQDSVRPAKAPIAGHFLSVHPARDAAEAAPGAAVFGEQIIGFVRIGPLLMPVQVEEAGTLDACVAEPGGLVGYGDTVFRIEPGQ
jgi:biotin carboxyl carrier protein